MNYSLFYVVIFSILLICSCVPPSGIEAQQGADLTHALLENLNLRNIILNNNTVLYGIYNTVTVSPPTVYIDVFTSRQIDIDAVSSETQKEMNKLNINRVTVNFYTGDPDNGQLYAKKKLNGKHCDQP